MLVLAVGAVLAVVALRQPGRPPAASTTTPRQLATVRDQAATWITAQVSPDAMVSCDRVMCAALAAHGFPQRELLMLRASSPDPASSQVVVETAAVESYFGSSLAAAWAPDVLASFGSGSAAITVRIMTPHGAGAYQNALNADRAARQKSEASLLNDNQIVVSATARKQLAAGQVDSRLMLAIAALAGHQSISVVRFRNLGPGAGAALPLRCADLARSDPAASMGPAAYVQSARTFLESVDTQFRPARIVTARLPDGQAVIRVEFTAPSPLGLLGP